VNNFTSTQPVSDPALFVGRGKIIESLQENVRSTVFVGEARIGKTSLLIKLKRELEGVGRRLVSRLPLYMNLRNPRFREPKDVYQAVASYITGELGKNGAIRLPEFVESNSDSAWLLRFFEQLHATGLRLEVIVLMDNLDRPEAFLSQRLELYSGLRQVLDFSPEGFSMKLVASATSEFLVLEPSIISKLLSRLQVVPLEALSLDDTRRLISQSPFFDSVPRAEVMKEFIFEQCGGHPSLLQEVLANVTRSDADKNNLREILERECNELEERGGSFFQQYMSELAYEDIIYLLAIALQAGDQEWRPPQTVVNRFVAAGLVREGPGGLPEPSCKIFFKWFRRNVARISPGLSQAGSVITDHDSLMELLQTKLRLAVGGANKITEKLVQDIINTMLITAGFHLEKEFTFHYKDKAYRSDFILPDLRAALEIKLIKTSSQVGPIIDQLEADLGAYQSRYRYLFVLVYDLSNSSRIDQYVGASENPFIRYIVIRH
jgi:AAA+ ATPase superfamily predicted ATPase